ncbi:Ig-like domain repeat protein [Rhodococcus oryzae]|uniref:Ig-like domain repeat protein n=1 Tax=Rhodococcus oryzae TaxID=2571143 RepID=A0ABY2RJM3_9NOCA|nr:Ig-like domain-containing protein [Rhodococcus oryzae]TJZ77867.1 Ig-like domain repeat protein [Rhodococcus oryzae]
MTSREITRGIAAGAAATLTIGALALLGAGTAGADPGSITWSDGSSQFIRTISNTTPAVGDTITVTTKFQRTSWTDEYIYNVKDRHHSCLTYVPGSAKMIGQNEYPVANPEVNADEAYVRASWGVTDWVVRSRPGFWDAPIFSVAYKVGANCPRGTALTTGMDYGGSLGSGSYGNKGPSITVGTNPGTTDSTTTLNPVTGATVGKATTLTAKVNPANAGGTVTFKDGETFIGAAQVGSDGTATATWTPATAGQRTVTAYYSGKDTVDASSDQKSVTVAPAGSTGGTGSLGSLLGGFGSSK